jgi:glyoxylase-like metal-dependent hydrolase (beta-lactamase superfamily II)
VASAARIYGDRMDRLWGAFEPVPADRVVALDDGAPVPCGRRRLVALHTPGHASHHVAVHDEHAGDVYAGDVAGVRLAGAPYVRPPTPPPDVDLDAWRASVARLRALGARRLVLTHFGAVDDVDWHLDDLLARLFEWAGWIEGRLEGSGAEAAAVVDALAERGRREVARALAAHARRRAPARRHARAPRRRVRARHPVRHDGHRHRALDDGCARAATPSALAAR